MKIKRMFYGREIEIELTDRELFDAYYEQQFEFDRQDIIDAVDDKLYEPSFYDLPSVVASDSVLGEQISNKQRFQKIVDAEVEKAAMDMRRMIDKYGCDWEYARDEALKDFVSNVYYCCKNGTDLPS